MQDEDPLSPAARQRYIDELGRRAEDGPTLAEQIAEAERAANGLQDDFDDAMSEYRTVLAERTQTRSGLPRDPNAEGIAEIEEGGERVNEAEEALTLARSRLSHLLGEHDRIWAEILSLRPPFVAE